METGGSELENVRTEAQVREDRRCYSAMFEDGGWSHEPKNAGASRSWKRTLPQKPSEGITLLTPCIEFS